MARLSMASHVVRGLASLAIVVAVALPTELAAAKKAAPPTKKPIRNPKFDPSAEQIDLFDGVDAGQVTVKLIPRDAMGGTVLIENKTDKPLTVKIPEVVVGTSIHSQFGAQGLGNLIGANNPGNNNGLGNPGGGGQQQQGGVVGMNNQNPGNNIFGNNPNNGIQNPGNGPGLNFFSVPAEKVISLTFTSVCLEYGKPEPDSASKYTLIPFSKVSNDPILHELLASLRTGKVDPQAVQAAVWHQANNMSFQELAEKQNTQLPGPAISMYFSAQQIQAAKQLLAQATSAATTKKLTDRSDKKSNTEVKVTATAQASTN